MLIGSCFGGLFVAQAVVTAASSGRYAQIFGSIRGVLFLGTPLAGTKVANQAEWLVCLLQIYGKDVSPSLCKL